jgi:hypothetical protein
MAYGGERTWRQRHKNEIHKQGIDALVKVLGPVDTVRFLQIYDQGSGDYTEDEKTVAPERS